MIRLALSALCGYFGGGLCVLLFRNAFQRDVGVLIVFAFAIIIFVICYKIVFKNVPTLKNALMKVSADTKDVINAKNKGKR